MKYEPWISVLLICFSLHAKAAALPEPGPENGGLRLRLTVTPSKERSREGYAVRIDVLNVGREAVVLRAAWPNDSDKGDVKDYIEAATSIEAYPAIAPWTGQTEAPRRTAAQPEHVLKPGEVLNVEWAAEGNRLKTRVSDPLAVQNPEFPFPGLYSVHAMLRIETVDGALLLRSNEQLVPIGGSVEMPKHTYGQVVTVDAGKKVAWINLGSLHKVAAGDVFQIRTGMIEFWKLTISEVNLSSSTGRLEPLLQVGPNPMNPNPRMPERFLPATLINPVE